jgi:DNA-binding NarL/FixJ family response regulator
MSEFVSSPRVVIVDDHDVFRRGLAKLLVEQGLDVVGQAADGWEGIKAVGRLAPDVVVMDLSLPRMSGIDEADVTQAILAGACGYLLKDASIDEIVAGVKAAAAGESLISSKVATSLLAQIRSTAPAAEQRVELSDREVEVMRLVAEGMDNGAIAEALFISPQTVKNHISNILAKLQMDNRIQAAVYAVRQGLV